MINIIIKKTEYTIAANTNRDLLFAAEIMSGDVVLIHIGYLKCYWLISIFPTNDISVSCKILLVESVIIKTASLYVKDLNYISEFNATYLFFL